MYREYRRVLRRVAGVPPVRRVLRMYQFSRKYSVTTYFFEYLILDVLEKNRTPIALPTWRHEGNYL